MVPLALFSEYLLEVCHKRREITRDNDPNNIEIHRFVAVDEPVVSANDLPPGDLRLQSASRI